MNKLITMVENYLGPKLSGVVVAAVAAIGQITSAQGIAGGGIGVMDIISNAAQTDLLSFLPAPIAGITAMLLRSTNAPQPIAIPIPTTSYVDVAALSINKEASQLEARVYILEQNFIGMNEDFGNFVSETTEVFTNLTDELEKPDINLGEPQPLNIRQNNPGNIESTVPGGNRWKGEMDSTNRYAVFESEEYGVRAMLYLLKKVYFDRHSLKTVHDIIHRWAPLGDNSPESVNNYIKSVSEDLGIASKEILYLDDDEQLVTMLKSMAEFEGGRPLPYVKSVYTKALELL